jgi:hypothetical protein
VTPLAGTVVGPGQSYLLKAMVTLSYGEMKQAVIQVNTSSKTTPELAIPINLGSLSSLPTLMIATQPDMIMLRGLKPGETASEEFEIVTVEPPGSDSPLLSAIRSDVADVKAEIVETGPLETFNSRQSHRRFHVRLTYPVPERSQDTIVGRLELETSQPIPDLKPIPFRVLLATPVRFVPERIAFDVGMSTVYPLERTIIVRGEPTLDIVEAASTHDWLDVKVLEDDDADNSPMATLRLTMLRRPEGDEAAHVRVKTVLPDEQERLIAVVLSVSE